MAGRGNGHRSENDNGWGEFGGYMAVSFRFIRGFSISFYVKTGKKT